MKILIIQLARIGDILLTWPSVRALRRMHPNAEIHFLVKERFSDAVGGLVEISKTHVLPSEEIFSSLLAAHSTEIALQKTEQFMEMMYSENYDLVINFSFSPVSSFITNYLSNGRNQVLGYSRHTDGYFNVADEISAYFHAQVGCLKKNRFHVADLMASMLGADLIGSDWKPPFLGPINLDLPQKYIVLHVGASEEHKMVPAFKWSRILKNFFDFKNDYAVVLIGSTAEINHARAIQSGVTKGHIVDLVGLTEISELFSIIARSKMVIGADSMAMHVASLTQTPCLNISLGKVNFWETGPRSSGSYIYRAITHDSIHSEVVARGIVAMIHNQAIPSMIQVNSSNGQVEYITHNSEGQFEWELMRAIYLGEKRPVCENLDFFEGILKLNEVNQLALDQLSEVKKVGLDKVSPILDSVDEVIDLLGKKISGLDVIVNWFKTEKLRIPPNEQDAILEETIRIHRMMKNLLRSYIPEEFLQGSKDGTI